MNAPRRPLDSRWYFLVGCDGYNALETNRSQAALHERRTELVEAGEICGDIERIPQEFLTDER